MNILITGASGFIGSFLCEEALKRRYTVWAGMRKHSSRKWLQNEWLNFVTLDLTDAESLRQQLVSYKKKYGKWDVIIHAGGATKCRNAEDFDINNHQCTVQLIEALEQLDMVPKHFIYLSSLSVVGAIREEMVEPHSVIIPDGVCSDPDFIDKYTIKESVYLPLLTTDNPKPNTAYGKSKAKSEEYLKTKNLHYTIFRPTGVYGPREKDYFIMAKSISNHYDFAAGFKPQEITFVYVRDLANAIFASIGNEKSYGKTYSVSDGFVYNSRSFSDLIQKELDKKFVCHFTAPLFLLKAVCWVSGIVSKISGNMSPLNDDKYNILSQRNWQCDLTPLLQDLDFVPQWNLEQGVKETIKWYKENKWL